MQDKNVFTIEEIRNYILSQDSMGDIMYNLNEENIIKANEAEEEECDATESDLY